jgi:ATP-dependent Clp protease ATP-binding subunit ClpA
MNESPSKFFTRYSRVVLARSKQEAMKLESQFIGTEHVLLALSDCEGVAGRVLNRQGITYEVICAELQRRLRGSVTERRVSNGVAASDATFELVHFAIRETVRTSDRHYVGTGHLLLTASRVWASFNETPTNDPYVVSARILESLGVDLVALHALLRAQPDLGLEPL